MKSFLKVLAGFILAGVAMVAFSGCATSRKSPSAPVSSPPVAVVQPPAANVSPAATSNQAVKRPQVSPATMQASMAAAQLPGRMIYSSANNLIDPWAAPVTDAILWVRNISSENGALRVGDRRIGVPDENGNLVQLDLPPGEVYGVPDYKQRPMGYRAETQVDFLFLDDENNITHYLTSEPILWPTRGYKWGKEMIWDILEGTPLLSPKGPPPVKVPVNTSTANGSAIVRLQSLQHALSNIPAISTPPAAATPAAGSTSSAAAPAGSTSSGSTTTTTTTTTTPPPTTP